MTVLIKTVYGKSKAVLLSGLSHKKARSSYFSWDICSAGSQLLCKKSQKLWSYRDGENTYGYTINSPNSVQPYCRRPRLGVKHFWNLLTSLSASWVQLSWCHKEHRNCPTKSCPDFQPTELVSIITCVLFFCHYAWHCLLFSSHNWNRWVYLRKKRLV